MLTIRLQRAGKKNKPQYKVVLAQKTAAAQKKFVEIIGSYNPHTKELIIRDNERLNYWVNEQHVEVSATAHNLFVTKGLIKADKKKAFVLPKKEVPAEEAAPEAPAEKAEATEAVEAPVETVVEETPAPVETPAEEAAPEATPAE